MALTIDQKKELLLNSFNILKSNNYENRYSFKDIISKMAKLDLDTAVELWKFVLENAPDVVQSEGLSVVFSIGHGLENQVGEEKLYEIILTNPVIKNAIFCKSNDTHYGQGIIKYLLNRNNLEEANSYINDVFENPYREGSFGEFLQLLTERFRQDDEITEDAVEILLSWTNKIDDEEIKAKITIALLDYM